MTSEKWEDAWIERLQFLGPGRAAVIGWPGSRSVRIEAFVDERTAAKLVKEFGGKVARTRNWIADPDPTRKPLRIRGRLTVFGDAESYASRGPRPASIFIPAGMAFGTGDHATTASCLRMLCDATPSLPEKWCAVDAGCGSGILAIAAATLGAIRVEAFDFDPACVRIAKENARSNKTRSVQVVKADVLKWKPVGLADVVMANLFSDLLIQAAPRLATATKPGGWLIFSGVLRTQLAEVKAAFEREGYQLQRIVTRGKWCAGQGRLDRRK